MEKKLINTYKGMPKLLEGIIHEIIDSCGKTDITETKLISNSDVTQGKHRSLEQEWICLNKSAFGCKKDVFDRNLASVKGDVDKYNSRKDDANTGCEWVANGVTYYLWNEQAYENQFELFVKEFNRIYANEYEIVCNNPNEKSKEFSFYKITNGENNLEPSLGNVVNKKTGSKFDLYQLIFFGAPGTGKSHKIDYNLFRDKDGNPIGKGIKEIPENRKFRTTFHPDYDYAQFVGAYKPKKELNETTGKEEITYSFVPQVFAKAYVTAWKLQLAGVTETSVFLVIEEINRGNCAQIFGDIFQLLDRDSKGLSQYSIDADCDFGKWLEKEFQTEKVWEAYKKEVGGEGKLKLPSNLNILATMNTSDQSLFPMDSAFKRRFDWEYVPIKYAKDTECGENWNADEFEIEIGNSKYKWLDFLEKVNADIYEVTRSEDKQMGEFFITPKDGKTILFKDFLSKVLFYLWDSVYKDETERQTVFHFAYENGNDKIKSVTFQSLFGRNEKDIVNEMMKKLDVKNVNG